MSLNESKGNMYDFVTHTWNTIKGECFHDCSYCHPAGTKIMMSDFTQKNIEDVKIGDSIIGLKKEDKRDDKKGYYKFEISKVVDKSKRTTKTIKLTTDDNYIICTPEHPLMGSTEKRNCSDWKAAKAFTPYENLRYVSKLSRGEYSREQKLGYLKGIRDGDGCVFKHYNKEKREYLGFEIVCVDEVLRNKIKSEFKDIIGVELKDGTKIHNGKSYGGDNPMLFTRISKDAEKIESETIFRLNDDFAKGYLAGMVDTDGSVGLNGSIRISQSKTVNKEKYQNIISCCMQLGLQYREEINVIRILSDFQVRMRFLFEFGVFHSVKSQRLILHETVKGSKHSSITSITVNGEDVVYNLQTECENFIANGFIVHNCYMKRWGKLNPVRFDNKELKTDLGRGNFIFVGSSCDMFAKDIPSEWITKTLYHCQNHNNKYLFQTKNPEKLSDYMDACVITDKSVLCTTIESNRWFPEIMGNSPAPADRAVAMNEISSIIETYVTIEPILDFDLKDMIELIRICNPVQVNIGADSGNNNLPEPDKEKLLLLIDELKKFTTINNKSNLKRLLK